MDGLHLGQIWKIKEHLWEHLGEREYRQRLIPVAIIIKYFNNMVSLKPIVKHWISSIEIPETELEENYVLHSEPENIMLKGLKIGKDTYVYDGPNFIRKVSYHNAEELKKWI